MRRPQIDGKQSTRLPLILRRFSKTRPRFALLTILLCSLLLAVAGYSIAAAVSGGLLFPSLPSYTFMVPLKPTLATLPTTLHMQPTATAGVGQPSPTPQQSQSPTPVLTVTAPTATPSPTPVPARPTASAVIPAYWSNESGPWSQLIQTHPAGTVAIANFNAGPPSAGDSRFAQEITDAHNAGIRIVGYVPTNSGGRTLSAVQNDIANWHNYQIDGIFLDEALANASNLSYYQQVATFIRGANSSSNLIVMNAGWLPSTSQYLQTADIIVVFEGTTDSFSKLNAPGWMTDPGRFAVVIEGVGSSQISQLLQSSVQSHIGYIYLLDGVQVYNRLPSYWSQETAALSGTYI